MNAREFLKGSIYTRRDVDDWIAGRAFPVGKYDRDLGYLHRDHRSREGINDSVCTYTYNKTTRARRIINHADMPCRINTYGDSFTHCSQVNDGETWQEILAAHLGEPIRNFGIGGYSVYQMYIRMKVEEMRFPAKYVIMNIYDDDHCRNLVGWSRMRFGPDRRHFNPPQPYVKANPANKEFLEFANPCPELEDLYNFCDLDWTYEKFKDDFALRIILANTNAENGTPEDSYKDIEDLAEEYGTKTAISNPRKLLEIANALCIKAAVYASMRIVENAEKFAAVRGKKILYITSFSTNAVAGHLKRGSGVPVPVRCKPGYCYSPQFANFMRKKGVPWVNLMDAHVRDYSSTKLTIASYLKKYYVRYDEYDSHYSPPGNYFTAFATKNKLVEMLQPKPISYRRVESLGQWGACVAL